MYRTFYCLIWIIPITVHSFVFKYTQVWFKSNLNYYALLKRNSEAHYFFPAQKAFKVQKCFFHVCFKIRFLTLCRLHLRALPLVCAWFLFNFGKAEGRKIFLANSCSLGYLCIKSWFPVAQLTGIKAELFNALEFLNPEAESWTHHWIL